MPSASVCNSILNINRNIILFFDVPFDNLLVSTSFAETVKSSEPISTTLIGLIFFKERNSLSTYLTLVPICCGVGISCFHSDNFNLAGFLLAGASNICFSSRAVLAKKMSISFPDIIDEIEMFASISLKGLYFLIPLFIFWEGSGVELLKMLFTRNYTMKSSFIVSTTTYNESPIILYGLVVLNGMMFACYNLVSYVVLRKTDLVTHAVLNVFRRVVIILFTAYFFGSELSLLNIFGVVVAVTGVLLFGYFRSMEKSKSDN